MSNQVVAEHLDSGSVLQSGALLGLFRETDDAARAVAGLRAAGFDGRDLEVLSDAPYPEGAFGKVPADHHLYAFTLAGALAGLVVGLLLTIGTQLSYPLVTGGKPILSIPPMLTIIFEGTMLGALTGSGVICAVTNVGNIGRRTLRLARSTRAGDGHLDVVVWRDEAASDLARLAVGMLAGRLSLGTVRRRQARNVERLGAHRLKCGPPSG